MTRPALAFVDLETTGASIARDRITEIGIVEVDEDGVRTWSTLVNPEQPIPPFIADLTGITDDMVREAPRFDQVADEVFTRLKGKLFVAHNARFDYGFLKHEYRRLGRRFASDTLCTVKLSKALYPEHFKHSLDSLVERHGLQVAARHRALGDAELVWQFLQRVEHDLGVEPVWQTIATLSPRPVLPPQLDPELPDLLPDGPGVYLFYGEGNALLYVARAKELRKRILDHLSESGRDPQRELFVQLRRVDWIETPTELGATLLETRLIKQHKPRFNRALPDQQEWCAYTLVSQPSGAMRPDLVFANNGSFDTDRPLYGLFHRPRDAKQTLRKRADAFRLCLIHTGLETASKRQFAPCFGYQTSKRCDGACVGKEPLTFHNARLMAALGKLKLAEWPWGGPVGLRETDTIESLNVIHVVDRWRYKGAAQDEAAVHALLAAPLPPFDGDLYRLLKKALGEAPPEKLIRFPAAGN